MKNEETAVPVRFVFYVPGAQQILDEAVLIDGCFRGAWHAKDLATVKMDHPQATLITWPEARAAIIAAGGEVPAA